MQKNIPEYFDSPAVQLRASVFELALEVTENIPLPNGRCTCQRSPEAAFLRRPSAMCCTGFIKFILRNLDIVDFKF
jgi:hypothetical protein